MSAVIAASAIGTLMSFGYTELEAKRIRSFLPRRFQTFGQPLPPTNIDAWLIYRAVKHYLLCTNERGVFKPYAGTSGYLSMQSTETMVYVTNKEKISFSTVEFVRHFGDAFYTDMNEQEGKRIVRMNQDGSFVVKNRRLEQLFREMEQRANRPEGPGCHTNPYMSANTGAFYLPVDETYSASDIFAMYTHGALATEYVQDQNFRKVMLSGVDFHIVAKYLYFLYCEKLKGEPHGEHFEAIRFTITRTLDSRFVDGFTYYPHRRGNAIYFADQTALTPNGLVPVVPMQLMMNSVPVNYYSHGFMVRFSLNGHMESSPSIPLSVKKYFTLEEWATALNKQ
ncbi:hypothetical protein pEaSNUABM8_00022 [Erwinia phage pEa_SNUABM_8]|nr:hypothetical protein pEaSNUABM8_00022 [Erwinia phage pEa_SNUABM_8]QVW54773.1 hypothetical protein pEaSNUABM4_00020 [Erwinia phage pEa_SNUABM_4]